MFAHVVDAHIHQFDRIECASTEVRCRRRMRGSADKVEIDARVGERLWLVYLGEWGWMPSDCDGDIVECARAHHEALGRSAFFGRTTVVAYAAFDPVRLDVILDR